MRTWRAKGRLVQDDHDSSDRVSFTARGTKISHIPEALSHLSHGLLWQSAEVHGPLLRKIFLKA